MPLSTALRMPASSVRALACEIGEGYGPSPSKRKYLAPLLSIGVAAAATALVVAHADDFIRPLDRALHASWSVVAIGAVLEAASLLGYVVLLHRVVGRASARLRLKDSLDISLGGAAATRLLPTAGLGGTAVTIWALRACGVRTRELTERLLAFMLLLYGVYMVALAGSGALVAAGIVKVSHGRALGFVGLVVALAVTSAVLSVLAAPRLTSGLLRRMAAGRGRLARGARRAQAGLPALSGALQHTATELRRPHPELLGAVAWWIFDIAVLVAMLHAFGVSLPLEVLVLAYFLGTFFNLLPIPGSLSGGLVGVLIAFGAPVAGVLAAVLAYRAVAVWLPAALGIPSFSRLRMSVANWRASGAETAGATAIPK